jgi:hypothetical protein
VAGPQRIGGGAIAGQFIRTPPTAVVTAPASTISTTSTTVAWTYFSYVSRAQAQFRVKLRTTEGGIVLFDSGVLDGAGTSYSPDFFLSDSSAYTAVVSVSDGYDWSDEATIDFTVDLADVADYPDVKVGTVYEIAINGVGYMLADSTDGELQYRRQTLHLDAPRFAQGDTPFSEAIERYTFIGWSDFRDGAGQQNRNRADSSPAAFLDSESVNPFEDDGLRLLPATSKALTNTHSNPLTVVCGNQLYSLSNTNEIKNLPAVGGSVTTFTLVSAGTISALVSDGSNWYAADGANIFKNNVAVDPGPAWSTIDANVMTWAADRLCIAYSSDATTPNVFSTLTPDGSEEVPAGRITLPTGSTITSITGGDGYVWFTARRNQQGLVYAWKAGSSDAPFIAFEFPTGQFPQSIGFYLSNVFVRCIEPLAAGGTKAVIYRAATSSGRLIPQLVREIESGTDDHTVGSWAGDSRFALFSWKKVHSSGASGVGCLDLSSGGNARWLCAPVADAGTANGDVVSVATWNGRAVFSIAGYGVCYEMTTPVATGFLRTDISDLGTSVSKVYGQLKADVHPLPTGGGISVTYSLDAGESYSTDPFALSGAGIQTLNGSIDKQGVSLGLKITMTAAAASPVLRAITVRAHALGLADQVLILPVNCADTLADLRGKEMPESGSARGSQRARVLESLSQTRIRLQDIDWLDTQTATIWEVEQVEIRTASVFDRSKKKQVHSQVAVLQLRRSLK